MDTIKFLLQQLFKLIAIVVLAALIMWALSIFFPELSAKKIFSLGGTSAESGKSEDWLPAPGSLGGLLMSAKVPDENTNVYKPGAPYNGYANAYNNNYGGAPVDFIIYTSKGSQIVHMGGETGTHHGTSAVAPTPGAGVTPVKTPAPVQPINPITQKSLYIRNLSIYEGGHIYTGISFTGEAKDTMFKDGKFPIIIVDDKGKVITVIPGEATTNWSIPGWVRFRAKLPTTIPNKSPCTMVFQSANSPASKPIYVAIPVICN